MFSIVKTTVGDEPTRPEVTLYASEESAKSALSSAYEAACKKLSAADLIRFCEYEDNGMGAVHACICVDTDNGGINEINYDVVKAAASHVATATSKEEKNGENYE